MEVTGVRLAESICHDTTHIIYQNRRASCRKTNFQRRTHKTKNINNTKTASICLTLEGLYIRYGEWLLLYSHFKWLFYKYIQLSGHFNTDVVSSTIGASLFEVVQKGTLRSQDTT